MAFLNLQKLRLHRRPLKTQQKKSKVLEPRRPQFNTRLQVSPFFQGKSNHSSSKASMKWINISSPLCPCVISVILERWKRASWKRPDLGAFFCLMNNRNKSIFNPTATILHENTQASSNTPRLQVVCEVQGSFGPSRV